MAAESKPIWPSLLAEEFDRDADYSRYCDNLGNLEVLNEGRASLQKHGLERVCDWSSRGLVHGFPVVSQEYSAKSFGSGEIFCKHGVFRAENAEMILPNGVHFFADGSVVSIESTWQSRLQVHPEYKNNRSTNWKFVRLPAGNADQSSEVVEHPVLLAYNRSYYQYYHWIFDSLPKVWLAKRAGLSDLPMIVGPILRDSFQAKSLEILGIGFEQLLFPTQRRLKLKEAVIPYSSASETLKVRPSYKDGIHHKGGWDPEYMLWLNEITLNHCRDVATERPRRLYIDRRSAAHRRLRGAEDFENFLLSKGFMFIDPGSFSFEEQVALFSEAEIVVGPHGAGLSNILWGKPKSGMAIVEIFPEGLEDTGYTFISSAMGFRHTVYYGRDAGTHPETARTDIHVDSGKLIELVGSML